MYICIVNNEELSVYQSDNIYQNDNPAECIAFHLMPKYQGIDVTNYTAILRWIDESGEIHSDVLQFYEYGGDGYAVYHLKDNSEFTRYSGNNTTRVILGKVSADEPTEYILVTNFIDIEIK